MRNSKDSKTSPYYSDFGTTVKEQDMTIVYAAIRSYLNKTAYLCLPSEMEILNNHVEIEKKIKEF